MAQAPATWVSAKRTAAIPRRACFSWGELRGAGPGPGKFVCRHASTRIEPSTWDCEVGWDPRVGRVPRPHVCQARLHPCARGLAAFIFATKAPGFSGRLTD